MSFLVKSKVHKRGHWFAGSFEGPVGLIIGLAPVIFDAYEFGTREEAEECIREALSSDEWEVSEIVVDMSDDLKALMAASPPEPA
jgi:hypothetical protein